MDKKTIEKLQFILSSYSAYQREDIKRLLNDFQQRKGYFLRLAKNKFKILNDMDKSFFDSAGFAICNNLDKIKTYDFLTFFMNSFFAIEGSEFTVNNGGELDLSVLANSGFENIFKIYNNGDSKVYSDGSKKIYKANAFFSEIDLNTYLPQFLLEGVFLKKIEVIPTSTSLPLFKGDKPVFKGEKPVFVSRNII